MERKPPSSLGEFIAVIQRRKYWIILPFFGLVALGLALSRFIPRSYQSTTTIQVIPQAVSTAYVRPSTADVENRLNRIGMEVMSGAGFSQIIEQLNLYPEIRKKGTINQAVGAMRKDITVAAAADSQDAKGNASAFVISYIGRTPQATQQATKDVAELFVRENMKLGRLRAEDTDTFMTAQVAQAKEQLAAEQAKIQAFKNAHLGSLPEQSQANMGLISQYQTELQANSAAIDQDNQQRVYLQSVLNVNTGGGPTEAAPPAATPLQIELGAKQAELHADLLKYTPEHPDVVRLKGEIAALKVQIRQAPRSAAGAAYQTPQAGGLTQTDLLRSQLVALNTEMKTRNARQQQLEQKLNQMQGAVSSVPAVQTEFAALDSEYQEMQKNYNLLQEKQQEAAMAAKLDQNNDSEQFSVLVPANLPLVAYRPDPVLLKMGIVLLSLLAALFCAGIVELRDDTMHTSEEVADYLKLPVMVSLPKCQLPSDAEWKINPAKS